jgi:hypothetical protein
MWLFFWGLLKEKIFAKKQQTIMELRALIIQTCNEITEDVCRWVINTTVQWLRLALSNGPNWVGLSCPIHLRTETDPVFETLWYILSSTYKTMDKVQNKLNSSVQHTPSSESFQVNHSSCWRSYQMYWWSYWTLDSQRTNLHAMVSILYVSF